MENKRYAIVSVDNKCPGYTEEDFECPFSNDKIECEICRQGRYGDTKKQLIKKVAQVLFKRKYKINERLYGYMSDNFKKRLYTQCLEASKEIIEFLGVK